MANVVLSGNTSGAITIAAPDVSGTNTLTLPASTGTMITSATAAADVPKPTALSTASGSAPSYSARAWVNFNGNGVVAIRGSGNISSITDNGTGDYTVNFTTAMSDSNYAVTVGYDASPSSDTRSTHTFDMYNFLTGSVRVLTSGASITAADFPYVFLAIFR